MFKTYAYIFVLSFSFSLVCCKKDDSSQSNVSQSSNQHIESEDFIKGFKKYQKIWFGFRFNFKSSFLPKKRMPISARIISTRIAMTAPKILLPENNVARAKHNWLIGG